MIPVDATIMIIEVQVAACVIPDGFHIEPVDEEIVAHYARLLLDQPEMTHDLIKVEHRPDGRYDVLRGRHRMLGAQAAGREVLRAWCVADDGQL